MQTVLEVNYPEQYAQAKDLVAADLLPAASLHLDVFFSEVLTGHMNIQFTFILSRENIPNLHPLS